MKNLCIICCLMLGSVSLMAVEEVKESTQGGNETLQEQFHNVLREDSPKEIEKEAIEKIDPEQLPISNTG